MTTSNFYIGQKVSYINGQPCVYKGIIAAIHPNSSTPLIILGEDTNGADWKLWNAGYAVGACIHPSQIQ